MDVLLLDALVDDELRRFGLMLDVFLLDSFVQSDHGQRSVFMHETLLFHSKFLN